LWDKDVTFYMRENKYRLVKGGKEYLVKAHQERNIITPPATKKGWKNRKKSTFINNGMVDMQRKMDSFFFHLLNGTDFGDQNPSNGEV
jgi:hypothetical protein